MRSFLALLFPLFLASIATSLHAKVAAQRLSELVNRSDLIVVARVTKIDLDDQNRKIASIEVLEVLKGSIPSDLRFVATPSWTCDTASAVMSERALLFLDNPEGHGVYTIAHAGRGRMPIRTIDDTDYATLWVGDVWLPESVVTIPGPNTEYDFIRSVKLDAMKELIGKEPTPGSITK